MHYDSSSSVEHPPTMMPFDSSSSVEQICDRVLLTRNYFNLLSSVEKMSNIGICFVAVISIITGNFAS